MHGRESKRLMVKDKVRKKGGEGYGRYVKGSQTDSCVKLTERGSSQGRDVSCWGREPFWHMGSKAKRADTIEAGREHWEASWFTVGLQPLQIFAVSSQQNALWGCIHSAEWSSLFPRRQVVVSFFKRREIHPNVIYWKRSGWRRMAEQHTRHLLYCVSISSASPG